MGFMKSSLHHLQVNIDAAAQPFYKELVGLLGWTPIYEGAEMLGYKSEKNGNLWFSSTTGKSVPNHDERGLNHIGIAVEEQKDVDAVVAFLKAKNIPALYDTPRHRKEFAAGDADTYYQVMFETPDKILFEILFAGPLAK
jgi:catechol 2,3-dioxygenase-like lactoylglutathione lyase family enzyme